MKKVLFAGALAACMALSSAAFAAESFGTDGITGTYDKQAGTVSVTTIPETLTTGADQLTLVILSGASTDNPTIVKESIMYIDQDSASNANKFTGMGLLNGLADGPYTLRMGSDNNAAIAEVEFEVKSSSTGDKSITFIWGDVNEDGSFNVGDAQSLMGYLAGGSEFAGSSKRAIGQEIELKDGSKSEKLWGDVNEDNAFNVGDAQSLMGYLAGGSEFAGSSKRTIGEPTTIDQ